MSKGYYPSEVKQLVGKLMSWREETNKEFSDIIDAHAKSSIKEGFNDLAKEVTDLRIKLSVITQERNDLLKNVNELNG